MLKPGGADLVVSGQVKCSGTMPRSRAPRAIPGLFCFTLDHESHEVPTLRLKLAGTEKPLPQHRSVARSSLSPVVCLQIALRLCTPIRKANGTRYHSPGDTLSADDDDLALC